MTGFHFLKRPCIFVFVKQFFAAIVMLVYFCTTTGFVISLHYCMDRFDSAEIGAKKNDRCGKCGMHKNGCCRDDVKIVKLQTSHVASRIAVDNFSAEGFPSLTTDWSVTPVKKIILQKFSIAHGPPAGEPDIYLQNRMFRI